MLLEQWKPVVGFEGRYEVSDLGRVRSLDRTQVYQRVDQYSGRVISVSRRLRGRVLRLGRMSSGHLSVVLAPGAHGRTVHSLVLEAFVGPCPPGMEGLHFNDDPANNRLANLRWGTRRQNLLDAVRNGKKPVGEKHHLSKLTRDQVTNIKAKISWPRGSIAKLAQEIGVSDSTIRQVISGKRWKTVTLGGENEG